VCTIYEDCCRKTWVKSIEIESGASHPPAGEAPLEGGKRILLIDQNYLKRGGLLGGVSSLQKTGLTGPISIYKVVPKVAFGHC
jgi:hypothetical protein